MSKALTTLLVGLFLVPSLSFAQTTTPSQVQILALIASLTQQVQQLQAQLAAQIVAETVVSDSSDDAQDAASKAYSDALDAQRAFNNAHNCGKLARALTGRAAAEQLADAKLCASEGPDIDQRVLDTKAQRDLLKAQQGNGTNTLSLASIYANYWNLKRQSDSGQCYMQSIQGSLPTCVSLNLQMQVYMRQYVSLGGTATQLLYQTY